MTELSKRVQTEAQITTPVTAFSPVRASSLAQRPMHDRQFVVEGLLPSGTVSGLVGDGGLGKSSLAMHQAVCVVLGKDWMGLNTIAGPAVYLSGEDDLDEVHRRLSAIAAHERVSLADLANLVILPLAGSDAVLATPDHNRGGVMRPTERFHELRATVQSIQPKLLVLDTLADVFSGNEIDRLQARSFVAILTKLAIEFRLAVLVLSHPSVAGMQSRRASSGSTAWANSMRSRMSLERCDDDDDTRVLSVVKANYGRTGLSVTLRWCDGVFARDEPSSSNHSAIPAYDPTPAMLKARKVFLTLLGNTLDRGERVSPKPSPSFAPKQFERAAKIEGVPKRHLIDAMSELIADGFVLVETYGPPSKRREFLTLPVPSNPPSNSF